jgi:hypothetical protein
MTFLPPLALITLAMSLFVSAAFGQKVNVDTDNSFDFTRHRNYMWREHPLAQKDPGMREATVAAQIIQSTVNDRLLRKGFQPVDHEPDFYITFFVTGEITEELRLISSIGATSWYGWGPAYYSGWEKWSVDTHLHGILMLDFVDAKTNQLAWRAYCSDTIEDMSKRHENMTRAVDKAFKKFPPPAPKRD